jgi:hypothetical protein
MTLRLAWESSPYLEQETLLMPLHNAEKHLLALEKHVT